MPQAVFALLLLNLVPVVAWFVWFGQDSMWSMYSGRSLDATKADRPRPLRMARAILFGFASLVTVVIVVLDVVVVALLTYRLIA